MIPNLLLRCIHRLATAPEDSIGRLGDDMMSHPLERTLIDKGILTATGRCDADRMGRLALSCSESR